MVVICVCSETADTKSTYHMYVENSRAGIMKRSGMDVDLTSDVQTLPIYSVSRVTLSFRFVSRVLQCIDIDSLSSLDLRIHEARDLAQNQPLWRLMSLHSAMHL